MKITQFALMNMIGLTLLLGCDSSEQGSVSDKTAPPKVVAWVQLSAKDTSNQRLLTGTVSAAERTRLSFQAQGQVQKIHVKVGQRFQTGQALATLDTTNYRLQLQQAKAKLNTAIAQRNQARTEVKRREKLVKSKAVSKSQLDAFRLQLTSAQQSINAATAQVELAEKQFTDTTLVAPFDGTVTAQLAEVAQLVSPSVPIFSVEADQAPEVSFAIPENSRATMSVGQTVKVTFPALPNETLSGTISEISAQAQVGAFPATLTLTQPPATIQAGMTAEIHFTLANAATSAEEFAIPPSALGADENNRHFVYRIMGEGEPLQLEKVPVTVKNLSGNEIIIQAPLTAEDKLVRSGMGFLHPDQAVTLMGEGAKRVNP